MDGLERLIEESRIRELVHRYTMLCDNHYEPDGLVELFTEDAAWTSVSRDLSIDYGEPTGRDAIHAFFAGVTGGIGETIHTVSDPLITFVSDSEATGRWNTTVWMKEPGDPALDRATILVAVYDHTYRRVGDEWLFSDLRSTVLFKLEVGQRVGPALSD